MTSDLRARGSLETVLGGAIRTGKADGEIDAGAASGQCRGVSQLPEPTALNEPSPPVKMLFRLWRVLSVRPETLIARIEPGERL